MRYLSFCFGSIYVILSLIYRFGSYKMICIGVKKLRIVWLQRNNT